MKNSTGYNRRGGPRRPTSALGALGRNTVATTTPAKDAAALAAAPEALDSDILHEEVEDHTEDVATEDGGFDEEGAAEPDDDGDAEPVARRAVSHSGSYFGVAFGAALALAGVALAAAAGMKPEVRAALGQLSIAPLDFVVLGVVMAGTAGVRRRLRAHEAQLRQCTDAADLLSAQSEQTHAQLGYLVEADLARAESSGSSDGMHQALHLIRRQEEKINNLSKATKLYGKPLLEISNQIAESTHQIGEMSSMLNAVKIIVEQSSNRLEAAIRAEGGKAGGGRPDPALEEIARASRESVQAIEALQAELSQRLLPSSERVADEMLAAAKQSLQTVESLRSDLSSGLAQHAEKVSSELAQLDRRVDHVRAAILSGIQGLTERSAAPSGGGGGGASSDLTAAVNAIHSELSALGDAIGSLQVRMAPGADADSAPPAASSASGPGGNKGVLGAIAKLKQLRQ